MTNIDLSVTTASSWITPNLSGLSITSDAPVSYPVTELYDNDEGCPQINCTPVEFMAYVLGPQTLPLHKALMVMALRASQLLFTHIISLYSADNHNFRRHIHNWRIGECARLYGHHQALVYAHGNQLLSLQSGRVRSALLALGWVLSIFSLVERIFIHLLLIGLPIEVFLYWHQYPYLFGLPFCKLRAFVSEALVEFLLVGL